MDRRLRILHLEDEPDFAELVRTLFAEDGLDAELVRVGNRADYEQALAADAPDLIISDFHLPAFSGLEALALAKKSRPHVPFILVSGTIGEQAAIDSLKAGATDYVLKQQPERLPSAVRRAVQESDKAAKLREAETELLRREKYFRALTENSLDILCIISREGQLLYVSPSVTHVLGYAPEELRGGDAFARVHAEDLPRVREAFQSALAQPERTVKAQFRHKSKSGEWRRLEMMGKNRLDEPDIAGVVTGWRDVTDRCRAEEELRDSERQYRLLFHGNPNPMWVFDLETQSFLEVNDAALQHYGYAREEFLRMTIADLRAPERNGRLPKTETGMLTRGVIWRHRRKDGSLIDVEVIWSPMVFHDRFAALTMVVDVTERRRLEHRNAVFARLSHQLSAATTALEAARMIGEAAEDLFRWTDLTLDLYDATRDEVVSLLHITTLEGQHVEIAPSPAKTITAPVRRALEKGAELVPGSSPGEPAAMLAPIRKAERVIGVLQLQKQHCEGFSADDLAMFQTLADQCGGALERIRAEQALHESQQRFRDLFENSPDAILVEAPDGTVLDANFTACLLHGLTREQLVGQNAITNLIPAGQREAARRDFQKLAAGQMSWAEAECLTSDGSVVPVEMRASRIEYGGQPALLLHVRDITERRAAAAALRNSEAMFRSIWENSVDGMRLTDEQGIIVAVNDAYCKLVGLEERELKGRPFTTVYAPSEDWDAMMRSHREQFAARRPSRRQQTQRTLHDGRTLVLESSDSYLEVQDQALLKLSLFRDVTTQWRLEEQLRQSQKMEAIGQLAGGVAHDFNNILTVIHGHASLLTMSSLDDAALRSAQQIVQAAERAAGLTRQLLTFSRRQLIQPKRLDLNKIVGNMTDMLGRLLGENISLQLNYCPTPAMVEADAGTMEQVLLNLAVNARDAMPRGGTLALRIAVTNIDETRAQSHAEARPGRFACLSLTDTGCGIPRENLPRIFEPFFTTKEIGRGTGLGLATVYGIVKQHQGWVEVESVVGKGSTFRVFVPCLGADEPLAEKSATPIVVKGGTETLLIVEDEKPVRELVARVLEKHGYCVLQAGSGAEALEVWHAHRDGIALLLTDLIMPGNMNGRELAEALRAERPELKVIFTSGYSADIVGKDFKLGSDTNFLQKPYHPQTLALTVRRCLDGKK